MTFTPAYDAFGRMTRSQTAHDGSDIVNFAYTYDANSNIISQQFVHRNGSPYNTYTYDALGRRISKTVSSVTTKYVYDGFRVIAEYTVGTPDVLVRKYIYGPGLDEPVIMIDVDGETETLYYYHQDANGNIICMTDEDQEIVEGYSYDAFGQCTVITSKGTDNCWLTPDGDTDIVSAIGNPYLFTGRRLDDETGLYYYRFRMYDPAIGRFCQTDPISYAGGFNLYAYVGNNPLNWIDPWGWDSKSWYENIKWQDLADAQSLFWGALGDTAASGVLLAGSGGTAAKVGAGTVFINGVYGTSLGFAQTIQALMGEDMPFMPSTLLGVYAWPFVGDAWAKSIDDSFVLISNNASDKSYFQVFGKELGEGLVNLIGEPIVDYLIEHQDGYNQFNFTEEHLRIFHLVDDLPLQFQN